jgi:hypothetical protein
LPSSQIYLECLSLFTSGRVELLANKKLENELAGLERRTARGGRDSIDHGRGEHDDLAKAACGALLLASTKTTCDFCVIDMGGRMISSEGGVITVTQLDDNGKASGTSRVISKGDLDMSALDRSRRAALGPDWRSKIPRTDPQFRD